MCLIGLTGGIASGKSTVGKWLQTQDIPVVDADDIAREVVAPGQPAWQSIVNAFGQDALQADQQLNRTYLRTLIFSNAIAKQRLENITHPIIHDWFFQRLNQWQSNHDLVVGIHPLLFEKKLQNQMDGVMVTDVTVAEQIQRGSQRDQQTPEQIQRIIEQQVDRETRLNLADWIIHNHGSPQALTRQMARILHEVRQFCLQRTSKNL